MQKFEVNRVDGIYPEEEVREKFNQYGIVLLKKYLPLDTRDAIRDVLTERLESSRKNGGVIKFLEYPKADFMLGDILSVRGLSQFNYVFLARNS